MGFETRATQFKNDERYKNLKDRAAHIETQLKAWIADAKALHTVSPDEDKPEVTTLRELLKSNLMALSE